MSAFVQKKVAIIGARRSGKTHFKKMLLAKGWVEVSSVEGAEEHKNKNVVWEISIAEWFRAINAVRAPDYAELWANRLHDWRVVKILSDSNTLDSVLRADVGYHLLVHNTPREALGETTWFLDFCTREDPEAVNQPPAPIDDDHKIAAARVPNEPETGDAPDETGLYPEEVAIVMAQANCSRAKAIKALRKHGDFVDATIALAQ
jgi:NACalpha-BTF3-like transcription factor